MIIPAADGTTAEGGEGDAGDGTPTPTPVASALSTTGRKNGPKNVSPFAWIWIIVVFVAAGLLYVRYRYLKKNKGLDGKDLVIAFVPGVPFIAEKFGYLGPVKDLKTDSAIPDKSFNTATAMKELKAMESPAKGNSPKGPAPKGAFKPSYPSGGQTKPVQQKAPIKRPTELSVNHAKAVADGKAAGNAGTKAASVTAVKAAGAAVGSVAAKKAAAPRAKAELTPEQQKQREEAKRLLEERKAAQAKRVEEIRKKNAQNNKAGFNDKGSSDTLNKKAESQMDFLRGRNNTAEDYSPFKRPDEGSVNAESAEQRAPIKHSNHTANKASVLAATKAQTGALPAADPNQYSPFKRAESTDAEDKKNEPKAPIKRPAEFSINQAKNTAGNRPDADTLSSTSENKYEGFMRTPYRPGIQPKKPEGPSPFKPLTDENGEVIAPIRPEEKKQSADIFKTSKFNKETGPKGKTLDNALGSMMPKTLTRPAADPNSYSPFKRVEPEAAAATTAAAGGAAAGTTAVKHTRPKNELTEEQIKEREEAKRLLEERRAAQAKRVEEIRKHAEAKKAQPEAAFAVQDEKAKEADEAKKAEEARLAEEARIEEEARLAAEAAKAAELARIEEARRAEEAAREALEAKAKAEAIAAEARKLKEAAEAAERARKEEEARKLEERRKAEEAKKAEEARKAEAARVAAETRRIAEETRKAEEARRAEEARKAEAARAAEAEKIRLAEEAKKAEEIRKAEEARALEEAKKAEEIRKAEEARALEEAKAAEQAKLEALEAERAAAAAKAEAEAKLAEAQKAIEAAEAAREVKAEMAKQQSKTSEVFKSAIASSDKQYVPAISALGSLMPEPDLAATEKEIQAEKKESTGNPLMSFKSGSSSGVGASASTDISGPEISKEQARASSNSNQLGTILAGRAYNDSGRAPVWAAPGMAGVSAFKETEEAKAERAREEQRRREEEAAKKLAEEQAKSSYTSIADTATTHKSAFFKRHASSSSNVQEEEHTSAYGGIVRPSAIVDQERDNNKKNGPAMGEALEGQRPSIMDPSGYVAPTASKPLTGFKSIDGKDDKKD